jgi:hypothetical protein
MLRIAILVFVSILSSQGRERYQPLKNLSHETVSAARYSKVSGRSTLNVTRYRAWKLETGKALIQQRYKRSWKNGPKTQIAIATKHLRDPRVLAKTRGLYAEEFMLRKNPYMAKIAKENAAQHDLYYRRQDARQNTYVQVKTLGSGDPKAYAREMKKDFLSQKFAVPDDHYQPVRDHWRKLGRSAETRGDDLMAKRAYRQRNRVTHIGATLGELDRSVKNASKSVIRQGSSRYLPLAVLPLLLDSSPLLSGSSNEGPQMLASGTVAYGSWAALNKFKGGVLRNTMRGNLLIGLGFVATDAAFRIGEHGVVETFTDPEFLIHAASSTLALAAAGGVGAATFAPATVLAAPTGPLAPAFGAGAALVTSTLTYAGTYLVTATAGRAGLYYLSPDLAVGGALKQADLVEERLADHLKLLLDINSDL